MRNVYAEDIMYRQKMSTPINSSDDSEFEGTDCLVVLILHGIVLSYISICSIADWPSKFMTSYHGDANTKLMHLYTCII